MVVYNISIRLDGVLYIGKSAQDYSLSIGILLIYSHLHLLLGRLAKLLIDVVLCYGW